MAASAASEGSSPGLCPSYAVICSFLERYGALLDLPELTFPQLERYLQDTSSVPKLLVDLHVKLLRKIGKSVSADRWEKYLVKVCHEFNSTWAWELENKGYKDMSVECKTGILKHLCECQFDDNVKFKTAINEEDPEKMRLQPIGKDRDGLMYWFQLDQDNNVRVYVEEQDDLDGSSWKCIVRDRNSLAEILELLKTQIDPALLTKKGEEDEKTREGDVKKKEDTSEDEEDKPLKDTASLISPKREITEKNSQKEELELDVSDAKFPSNGLKDNQVEATSQSEEPMVDDKVTINPQAIKEEPMDVSESKPLAEKPHVTPPIEQIEEAKRKTAEELQRAMKNDQQAKIPLKKREMKLSDDFDNNGGSGSSIIVRTPSVATVKETPKVEQTNKLVSVDLEGTVKETQSDQVNGDLQPVIERSINNGLRESSNQIRTQRECAYGKGQLKKDVAVGNIVAGEASAKEKTSFSMEKDNEEREMASNTMETMDGPIPDKSNQTNMVTATVTTKEIAEVSEKIKESSLKKSVPPLMTEPLTSSQDATIPPEMSDRKREKIVKTSKWDMKVRCTEVKTSTSIQTQNVSSSKSEKPEETKGMDSSFGSQPVTYKEISQTFLDICPLSVVKEKQTTEATEKWLDPKNLKTSVISKQTERPDPITEKPDCSKCTEMPAVIKNTEKTFSNKECAEKCDGSQDIGTFSVIKKTEISEKSKYENLVSPNETNTASVIKKADKPVPNKGDHLDSIKETVKSTVIKMTVKSEVSTHADVRCDGPTDIEMLAVTLEKSSSAASTDRKAAVETKSGLKNEMADISMKSTHLQLDEPKKGTKSATPEDAGKLSTAKIAGKSPSPDVAGKSPSPEAVARSASPEEAASSLKESVPMEEPMEIHLEKSMDDSDFKKYTDDGCPKKAVIGGEKSEIKPNKDLISLNCDAPSGNQATRKKASFLTEILSDEDKIHDRVMKEDVPQKDVQEDDQAKKKGDDKTKTDDKKEEEGGEKDDRTSAASGVKVSEGSEEDEPKTKKDEDKSEKQDAVTTSEIQEEGIRLKIRGITHRRKAELQREERDSGSDTGETGRSLRRSPRICRPTPKGVEFQDRRMEKKQTTPTVEKVDEENKEEEEQDKTIQRKPREKVDGQSKSKGRRRRKTRWSNTRTRRRKKNGSGEDEESESSEEESEEDDSDESFKVEGGKRRRRNRNRERHSDDSDTSSDDDLPPNDDPCKHCGLPNHPELILLCDSCDNGYHTACLRPPLMIIPDGEWFCPPCQHKLLCDKLEEQLTNLDAALKKRERAERRKERLVYVGISVENIITPSLEVEDEKQAEVVKKEKKEKKERIKSWGRRSTRTKKSISYRFDEFDEAIEEAIEEDIREADGGGAGRGKDMANITGHSRGKDMSTILAAGEGGEGKENGLLPPRPSAGQRRKKRRRLNDLDSDSTMEEEESEDEFRLSDSTEEEEFVASDKSGAESEVAVDSNDDSDFGSIRRRTARTRRPAKRQRCTRPRKRRKPEGYSDDEEEETSEEDEDEIVSEGSSEFSDSDLDCSRRRSRRSQTKKQVNYCESSGDSEGSKAGACRDKVKLRRRLDSSESEASCSRGSDIGERERTRLKRRADSSEEESRQRRRRLSLKRRRASEEDDDDDDDDSDQSSEGERPVRKRVNRIDSDDSDDEEKEKKEIKEEEEGGVLGKGASPLDYSLVELHPPTNGQSPIKALESLAHIGPQKLGATAVAIAPNGLEVVPQDDDEDDLLGVTDLVDFVCNSDVL